jgi:hypothetical protein
MRNLKTENIRKCVSLLREFIEESQEKHNKKGAALLALGQLQKIRAGTVPRGPQCKGHPRADLITTGGGN